MDKSATQWMVEPLKKYATFSGRARRKEYWWFQLLLTALNLAAFAVDVMINGIDALAAGATGYVQAIVSLALFLPSLAVSVRRLHDLDRRGWWLLLPLPPAVFLGVAVGMAMGGASGGGMLILAAALTIAVIVLMFYWFCSRGTVGDNRFGPDPLAA